MATWITSKPSVIVNLDHFTQIYIKKSSDEYHVVGMAPGLAISPEGDERYDETFMFSGTKEACEKAMLTIHQLLKPVELG